MKQKLVLLLSLLGLNCVDPAIAQQYPTCALQETNRIVVYVKNFSSQQLFLIQQNYPSARLCTGFNVEERETWVQVAQVLTPTADQSVISPVENFLSRNGINFNTYYVDQHYGYWNQHR